MVWWCPYGSPSSVRPSVRPYIRPSVRPVSVAHFPHFSPTCFDILSWNFAHYFVLMYYRSSLSVITLRQFLKEWCLFVELRIWEIQFSALFSYMLWHIELKFCTWLCFDVLQSKFECHLFASILKELCLFLNLEYRKYTVFRSFLLHALTYWAEILHMTLVLMYFRSSLSVITLRQFLKEWCLFVNLEYGKYNFPHFSPICFDILSWNFAHDFALMYYRASSSVISLRQFLKELCLFLN